MVTGEELTGTWLLSHFKSLLGTREGGRELEQIFSHLIVPQSTEGEGFPAQVSQAPSQAAFPGVPLETKHSMPFPAALTASGSGLRGQGTASRGMPTLQKLAFGGV